MEFQKSAHEAPWKIQADFLFSDSTFNQHALAATSAIIFESIGKTRKKKKEKKERFFHWNFLQRRWATKTKKRKNERKTMGNSASRVLRTVHTDYSSWKNHNRNFAQRDRSRNRYKTGWLEAAREKAQGRDITFNFVERERERERERESGKIGRARGLRRSTFSHERRA